MISDKIVDDRERQRRHFNRIADKYCSARQNPRLALLKKILWNAVFERASTWGLPQKIRVLEAMCGFADGYDVFKENWTGEVLYSGFDYSEEMVGHARQRYPEMDIFCHDVTLPMDGAKQNSYNVILLVGGLHHVHRFVERSLENLSSSLQDGGIFINFEPTNNNRLLKWIRTRIYERNIIFDEESERAFSTPEIHRAFAANKLFPIDELYPGLLAYILWYNPDAFPFLNRGSLKVVSALSKFEKNLLWRTALARYLSFATLTVYRKRGADL